MLAAGAADLAARLLASDAFGSTAEPSRRLLTGGRMPGDVF